jgi:hypothetical protein
VFYHRLFGIERIYARSVYVLAAITLVWCLVVLPLFLFSCRPVSKGWDPSKPGSCMNIAAAVSGAESVNCGIDLSLVLLAWYMIRPLRISISDKFKLGIIFAVGGL